MKGWSWGGFEVSKKVEKLHSESVQHYLNGVLINLGALFNMVGNQTWNSLTNTSNVYPKSQMRSCWHIG